MSCETMIMPEKSGEDDKVAARVACAILEHEFFAIDSDNSRQLTMTYRCTRCGAVSVVPSTAPWTTREVRMKTCNHYIIGYDVDPSFP